MRTLRQLDLFRVVQDKEKHLTPASKYGAAMTAAMLVFLVTLLLGEVVNYTQGYQQCAVVPRAMADPLRLQNASQLSSGPLLHLFIALPYIPCHRLAVSVQGEGMPLTELTSQIQWTRYHIPRGQFRPDVHRPYQVPISSGVPTASSATNDDETASGGCYVEVNAPLADTPASLNLFVNNYAPHADGALKPDHYISQVYAGQHDLAGTMPHITSATTRPLTDVTRNVTNLRGDAQYMYQYFLQFIETAVEMADIVLEDYQFTESWSTVFYRGAQRAPGVYFSYRHSTFSVECSESYDTVSHFIVHLCAVVGGVYVVASFLEVLLEHLSKKHQKRTQAAQNAVNTARALQENGTASPSPH